MSVQVRNKEAGKVGETALHYEPVSGRYYDVITDGNRMLCPLTSPAVSEPPALGMGDDDEAMEGEDEDDDDAGNDDLAEDATSDEALNESLLDSGSYGLSSS